MYVFWGTKSLLPPSSHSSILDLFFPLRGSVNLEICILPFSKHTCVQMCNTFFYKEIVIYYSAIIIFFHLTISHEHISMSEYRNLPQSILIHLVHISLYSDITLNGGCMRRPTLCVGSTEKLFWDLSIFNFTPNKIIYRWLRITYCSQILVSKSKRCSDTDHLHGW